jgi:hypothetical protein
MSDLSFAELDAEHGELLPERETLGVLQVNVGGAAAIGAFNYASSSQTNAVGSFDGNAIGSYDHDSLFVL